jgi:hypothetical protein
MTAEQIVTLNEVLNKVMESNIPDSSKNEIIKIISEILHDTK